MDIKAILEILRLVNKSDLTEVEIEEKDFKIRVKRGGELQVIQPSIQSLPQILPSVQQPVIPLNAPIPNIQAIPASSESQIEPPKTEASSKANTIIIRSPMIGTFYRAPGPDKEPFVKVGDFIKKKQVLCIIEAMKLFNEIESEVEGKIVKILVENAQPVEYDQPLFEVEV